MGWSIRVARVAGIEVKIHVTFLLLLAWIWFTHYQNGGTEAAWQGVLFVLLLFACVVLHEFGHAFAARRPFYVAGPAPQRNGRWSGPSARCPDRCHPAWPDG